MRKHQPQRSATTAAAPRFERVVVATFDTDDGAAHTRLGIASDAEDHRSFHIGPSALPVTGHLVMRLREADVF